MKYCKMNEIKITENRKKVSTSYNLTDVEMFKDLKSMVQNATD